MKLNNLFYSILFTLMLLSCNTGSVVRNATGLAYEIVVVMDKDCWASEGGKAIKSELSSDIPGLPQSEPAFKVMKATPDQFNGLLTYVRNILIVKVDPDIYTKVSLKKENNLWAKNQVVMTLTAPSDEEINQYMNMNSGVIVNFFNKCETNRTIKLLQKEYSSLVLSHVNKRFNVSLRVPATMTYYRDTTGFFWASNNAATGRTDVVVYDFPYMDKNTFSLDYLVHKRDSVMKANMPGTFPNTYMATEKDWVTYSAETVNGKYCGVLRGLWQMEGDMMGGPFVSHARLDEETNRIVVVEGFVFAPETDKRNFIRRIESALYTLRLPGDEDNLSKVQLTVNNNK